MRSVSPLGPVKSVKSVNPVNLVNPVNPAHPVARVARAAGSPATFLAAAIALAAPALVTAGLVTQDSQRPQLGDVFTDLVREPAIAYFTAPANDPVARLNQRIQSGAVRLAYDPNQGYLRSVLAALQLNVDSQMLVFSKTSVQAMHVNPRNPRALYFNDAASVGFVPDAPLLEFAAQDPRQGVVFYTLDQRQTDRPVIERRDFCLQCHYGYATLGVPGMLTRSVVTTPTGATQPRFGNYVTDDRSPLAERWAGWYVTGTHGSMRHLGNAVLENREEPDTMVNAQTLNVRSLAGRFEAEAYLSAQSDIAALLVFEHQARLTNLLARVAWDARVAPDGARGAQTREAAAELADALLFVGEAPLTSPIAGTSGFAERFSSQPPRDRRGRSLRELALDGRLMRYPCSYMIYSEAFDALPDEAREATYRRLWQVLSGEDRAAKYAHFLAADRQAIVDILRDTKKDLPAYYSEPSARVR